MNISLVVKDLHRFETLNKDSKKAQNIIDRYYNSNYSELRQAYKSYSREKEKAFNSIKDRMHKEDATGLRILGANSSFFSCAYMLKLGHQNWLIFDTACNTYKILL